MVDIIDFLSIEKKWRKRWSEAKIYEAGVSKKKKFFTSLIIPYVNGNIHVGHSFTYTRTDCYARYKRMRGFNALLAQGFHATGEPILGVIERLKKGDKNQIETVKMYGATDADIENFIKNGPEYAARFWSEKIKETMKRAGFAVDWRRSFITAIDPAFNRFIEWQYNTLRKKGYVVQGTHPVVWCPKDQSPTGDHDRLYGEGESPQEYVILKFRINDKILPCGTLRPETVYGVTNLWVREDVDYAVAHVNNEKWIISQYAAEKLRDQLRSVDIVSVLPGHELVGKKCINPITNTEIPVLPASFVDTDNVTGIVMSVPAHAPYDWVALKEMMENGSLEQYGVSKNDVLPVNVVKTEGLSDSPAVSMTEKIKSLSESGALEKITAELYKKEFYGGVLDKSCGVYSGLPISNVKDRMVSDFREKGVAEVFWDVSGVVCRCTTRCHVKILENQWFLKYSDEEWKQKVRGYLSELVIYPDDARKNLENTLDWLKDKACARKSGLGTRMPWDKEWIVETLSDSTIYMAYYTIARLVNSKKIDPDCLTDVVFNHVFFGKGLSAAKKSGLSGRVLKEMRKEFLYFYPVDMRNSAKDLIQNHLIFYLLHHAALFPKKMWPRAIGVNGYVNVEGEKMSKSKGNIIPLIDLINQFGADLVRMNIVASSEGLDDADWRAENIRSYRSRLEFLYEIARDLKKVRQRNKNSLDLYLLSRIAKNGFLCISAYEKMAFRSAVHYGLFETTNEMRWYLKRCGGMKNANKKVLLQCLAETLKLLAPIVPHFSEELWEFLGKKGFISSAVIKNPEKRDMNENVEKRETFIKSVLDDVQEIQKILKLEKLSGIVLYVAKKWKFGLHKTLQRAAGSQLSDMIRAHGNSDKERIMFIQHVFKQLNKVEKPLGRKEQLEVLRDAKVFLGNYLCCAVEICDSEESEDKKAAAATPYKPGIKIL